MAYNGDTFTMVFLCENVQLALTVLPRIATAAKEPNKVPLTASQTARRRRHQLDWIGLSENPVCSQLRRSERRMRKPPEEVYRNSRRNVE